MGPAGLRPRPHPHQAAPHQKMVANPHPGAALSSAHRKPADPRMLVGLSATAPGVRGAGVGGREEAPARWRRRSIDVPTENPGHQAPSSLTLLVSRFIWVPEPAFGLWPISFALTSVFSSSIWSFSSRMYCDESEWFSWPWMRPSSLCREGRDTVGQSMASPGVHPPPSSWGSPGSPTLRCAASSLPLQPCCLLPEGAQPSLLPYSEGKGVHRGRIKEGARSQVGWWGPGRGCTLHSASACLRRLSLS